jgi:2-dehydropantoate 2-reductase
MGRVVGTTVRVTIVGAGALGTTYAVLLARAGADVTVVARPERIPDLEGGLAVRGLIEASARVRVVTVGADLGEIDYLILATKVGDAAGAVASLAGARVGTAISLQNGLAKNDALDQGFGHERVLGAACAVVAGRGDRPGEAILTMNRATWLGERRLKRDGVSLEAPVVVGDETRAGRTERAARLAAVFRAAGLPSWSVPDGDAVEWYKLCALLPGSLVTALARCSYGEMALHPLLSMQFISIMRETFSVPASLGLFGPPGAAPIDPPGAPWSFGTWVTGPDYVALAGLKAIGQAQATAGQRVLPSMIQDVFAGRVTEVEALVGGLLARARGAGLLLPATETCYRLLRGLEDTAQSRR